MSRRWFVDIWDEVNDPAIRRMREALALQPTAEPVPEAAGATETAELSPAAPETRRERVAGLLERVRRGDRSAADILRGLLEK